MITAIYMYMGFKLNQSLDAVIYMGFKGWVRMITAIYMGFKLNQSLDAVIYIGFKAWMCRITAIYMGFKPD